MPSACNRAARQSTRHELGFALRGSQDEYNGCRHCFHREIYVVSSALNIDLHRCRRRPWELIRPPVGIPSGVFGERDLADVSRSDGEAGAVRHRLSRPATRSFVDPSLRGASARDAKRVTGSLLHGHVTVVRYQPHDHSERVLRAESPQPGAGRRPCLYSAPVPRLNLVRDGILRQGRRVLLAAGLVLELVLGGLERCGVRHQLEAGQSHCLGGVVHASEADAVAG